MKVGVGNDGKVDVWEELRDNGEWAWLECFICKYEIVN